VQAGAPPDAATVPEAAELAAGLDAPELAPAFEPLELVPAVALGALDELVPPPAAPGALDVDDDAAQPAARSPALSSGTTSNAFFTRSPRCNPGP
jgi:hypothetical protein